jgi:hypothetical protein
MASAVEHRAGIRAGQIVGSRPSATVIRPVPTSAITWAANRWR